MESNWGEDTGGGDAMSSKIREECKPDYEGMIDELKRTLVHTRNFYHACESFILHGPNVLNRRHLKDLVGHLHIEVKQKEVAIDKLMEKAEKEA